MIRQLAIVLFLTTLTSLHASSLQRNLSINNISHKKYHHIIEPRFTTTSPVNPGYCDDERKYVGTPQLKSRFDDTEENNFQAIKHIQQKKKLEIILPQIVNNQNNSQLLKPQIFKR